MAYLKERTRQLLWSQQPWRDPDTGEMDRYTDEVCTLLPHDCIHLCASACLRFNVRDCANKSIVLFLAHIASGRR